MGFQVILLLCQLLLYFFQVQQLGTLFKSSTFLISELILSHSLYKCYFYYLLLMSLNQLILHSTHLFFQASKSFAPSNIKDIQFLKMSLLNLFSLVIMPLLDLYKISFFYLLLNCFNFTLKSLCLHVLAGFLALFLTDDQLFPKFIAFVHQLYQIIVNNSSYCFDLLNFFRPVRLFSSCRPTEFGGHWLHDFQLS